MTIIFERIARYICKIILNRPEKRNALNLSTIKNLKKALEKFENDDDLSVAILGGLGGNFCAGYDLTEIVDLKTSLPRVEHIEHMLWPLGTRLSNKITIAAIDGHAAGFGYELALKCDYRVAEKDARLGFMNRRFGIPIMNGGTVILPKMIGLARASEAIATGCALGRSTNLARCLAKFHQPPLLRDLQSLHDSVDFRVKEQLEQERSRALEYLKNCGRLEIAASFIKGEIGRHGSFDMGNLSKPEPEVTL